MKYSTGLYIRMWMKMVYVLQRKLSVSPVRSQWPCGLKRRSEAAGLLGFWLRILPGTWMFVCCECCVLSGRGPCDELITRPEESYWLVRLVCDLETPWMRRSWPPGGGGGCHTKNKQNEVSVTERCTDQYVAVWINNGLQNGWVSR
jgi:hypothetical protein